MRSAAFGAVPQIYRTNSRRYRRAAEPHRRRRLDGPSLEVPSDQHTPLDLLGFLHTLGRGHIVEGTSFRKGEKIFV